MIEVEKDAGTVTLLIHPMGDDEGGQALHDWDGDVITENDWQIMGNENNRAICPPEEKWIGYKIIPFPHPTFVRVPPNVKVSGSPALSASPCGLPG